MKRILYSNVTKTIAVILFIVGIILTAVTLCEGYVSLVKEDEVIFRFEESYTEMEHVKNILESVEGAVAMAFIDCYHRGTLGDTVSLIDTNLSSLYTRDKVEYIVNVGGVEFTNTLCTVADLIDKEFYLVSQKSPDGNVTVEGSNVSRSYYRHSYMDVLNDYGAKGRDIMVCVAINDDYASRCKALWQKQAEMVYEILFYAICFAAATLIALLYLICVCGRNADGERVSLWIDNVWLEIHILLAVSAVAGAGALGIFIAEELYYAYFPPNLLRLTFIPVAVIVSIVVMSALLSVVRCIKNGRFKKASIIYVVARFTVSISIKVIKGLGIAAIKTAKKIFNIIRSVFRAAVSTLATKSGLILITLLLVYTVALVLLGIGIIISPFWLFVACLIASLGCFFVIYRSKDFESIKKGVRAIRRGELTYKIPEPKSEDMKPLADDINDMAKGLDESMTAKMKAERLKTELITNVSHDLKTPLTSIINYTELLSKMDDLPEEAKDYVAVLASKSRRLKNLTQDLFDISKAQSGNESVVMERLDASLLINQSLAEYDGEIKSSGLTFCVSADKDLYIKADGRKMSRVLSNLIGNVLKYTMKNTRVFISAKEKDGDVVIEFKNIASYLMNFDANEIIGRFVRGDESRTEEGNGLGLAIAKSYTELCGGRFEVIVDGDMFKVVISFKKNL